jgi:ATP-dependent DNA ligase
MLCLAAPSLPEGAEWEYELKLEGYRALAFKTQGEVKFRFRNNKEVSSRYPSIAQALQNILEETILDGELVAFDDSGRPSFNKLQNYGSSNVPPIFYALDVDAVRPRHQIRTARKAARVVTHENMSRLSRGLL